MSEPAASSQRPRGAKRVYIETYGCQMNVADSELMVGGLRDAGFEAAERPDDADVVLLNTCAVREKAEERIYGRVSQLLRFKYARPELVIGLTGCMAEHLKDRITERAPYVDLVVGPDAYRRLPDLIDEAGCGRPVIDVRLDKAETYEGVSPERARGVSGWITIQRGCDKFCTFCIVPYTRGRERGTAPREVLRQARDLAAMGAREVTLLGQTVNSYRHEEVDFADLVRSVASVDGLARVRYTSPYPVDFSPKLIATLADLSNVPNYLHLPLQSGSETVLDAMKRGYTVADYRAIVQALRAAMPDVAISTDLIVGFPGETDDDYRATLDLCSELEFDAAFTFAYSEREGTFASKRIPDTVPADVKQARLARLIEVQEAMSLRKHQRWVGREVEVLAEGPAKRGDGWFGKTADFKTAIFSPPAVCRPGDLVKVRVSSATAHALYAGHHALEEPARLAATPV